MRIAKESIPMIGAIVLTLLYFFVEVWVFEFRLGEWVIRDYFLKDILMFLFWGLFAYALSLNRFKGDMFYPLLGAGLCLPLSPMIGGEILMGLGLLGSTIFYFFRHRNKGWSLEKYEEIKGWLILSFVPLILLNFFSQVVGALGFDTFFVILAMLSLPIIVILNHLNLHARRRRGEEASLSELIEEVGEPTNK